MSKTRDHEAAEHAGRIFHELRGRGFAPERISAVARLLELESARLERGRVLRAWRERQSYTIPRAAVVLGLPEWQIAAIENESLAVGPEEMRAVRKALKRCLEEVSGE